MRRLEREATSGVHSLHDGDGERRVVACLGSDLFPQLRVRCRLALSRDLIGFAFGRAQLRGFTFALQTFQPILTATLQESTPTVLKQAGKERNSRGEPEAFDRGQREGGNEIKRDDQRSAQNDGRTGEVQRVFQRVRCRRKPQQFRLEVSYGRTVSTPGNSAAAPQADMTSVPLPISFMWRARWLARTGSISIRGQTPDRGRQTRRVRTPAATGRKGARQGDRSDCAWRGFHPQ